MAKATHDARFSALLSLTMREDAPDHEVIKALRAQALEPKKLEVVLDLVETRRPAVHAAFQARSRP